MNLFGTAGIRGSVDEFVTPELAVRVGRAVAEEVASQGDGGGAVESVVVGRDGRTSSPALADAVAAGLASGGARVVRIGLVPTPALAYAARGRAGVMVTASHNPPGDNGLKCFRDGQEFDAEAERRIEERVEADGDVADWSEWPGQGRTSPLLQYRKAVREYATRFGSDPDGLTIAVDCGNGVSSLATPQVLSTMRADVRALEANVDGHFPARESKPTPESLKALRSFVPKIGADLGIAHDGDGDRIVIVDADGDVVHEDTVLAIIAERYVRASDAETPVVVTTPNASQRIDERVVAAGGRVERTRLGALHEGMADIEGEVAFAAEPWKHVHPEFGPWIDGVASAAVFVRLVADAGLVGLRAPVDERPYRKESVTCPERKKQQTMDTLETSLPERFPDASVSTEHGVRLTFDDGSWVLVRPSGTERYVRVYAESDGVDELIAAVIDEVEDAVSSA